jgi:predicted ATPase/class 3 adenylate cyclase
MGVPSGTVTFFFTDVEGSTRLWEEHPDQMAVALRRHDDLIRDAIEAAGGHVFKTVGDAFCAAFTTAEAAARAARDAQRSLDSEKWPAPIKLQVRMALHTGTCEEREGDFFGPAVNRTARLEAVAHGGQVLISHAAAELIRDKMPESTALEDLGEHRLKDLLRSEHIFHLKIEGRTNEFPSLRTLYHPELSNNLPIQLTRFVGRGRELNEIRGLMNESRLVTLTGAGGSGKSRLALHVAAEALERFSEGGTWLVELASLDDPKHVVGTVASVLGVREEPGRLLLETLVYALSNRPLLLVLDNCEHVVDACAELVNAILRSCPRLSILTTSQQPLAIPAEHIYRVPSLSIPPTDGSLSAEAVGDFDALQLFADRARAVRSTLELSDSNYEAVASICRRLDGMPLAIELAAARSSTLSLSDIDQGLDDRFRLLARPRRTALSRHQTLRALIDWSYSGLDDQERVILDRLSVFAGGCDLESAKAVCGIDEIDHSTVVDLLQSLVDKSLVQADFTHSPARYQLLETIRQYGAEKLLERSEHAQRSARRTHALVFLRLTEAAASELAGVEQPYWFDRVERDLDNIRAAISNLLSDNHVDEAVRMAVNLQDFWFCNYRSEGVETLQRVLSSGVNHGLVKSTALTTQAYLELERGDYLASEAAFSQVVDMATAHNDCGLRSQALGGSALIALRRGDLDAALTLTEESIEFAFRSNDPFVKGEALNHRGQVRVALGLAAAAREDFVEGQDQFLTANNLFGVVRTLQSLTILELKAGNVPAARAHVDEALALRAGMRGPGMMIDLFLDLGLVALLEGDAPGARQAFGEMLTNVHRSGALALVAYALFGLALCDHADGNDRRSAELHGAADRLFGERGEARDADLVRLRDSDQQGLRRALGASAFDESYQVGQGLGLDEVTALALE